LAGQHPVGLASGVTAANVHEYIENTDISIVASGISEDYLNLNPEKVHELAQAIEKYNKAKSRQQFEQEMLKKYDV
jgi:predicted TIM-barrel enzyme